MSEGDGKETLWPRCYGGSEDVATKGAKNEILASVERNRLRSLSSPRDYDFRFRLRQRYAIPVDVIKFAASRSA